MITAKNSEGHHHQNQTGYPPVFTIEENLHNDFNQPFDGVVQHNLQKGLPPWKAGASTSTVRGSR